MYPIEKYFNAEKAESYLFITIGLLAVFISVYFIYLNKGNFYKGISYPFMAVALIQLVVGTTVLLRSPKDILRVNSIIQNDKSKIITEEIPRMNVVMKNFVIYRWIEIVLLLIGVCLYFYFSPMSLIKGIGLGLSIQSGIMLSLDYFAESRGKIYLDYLKTL